MGVYGPVLHEAGEFSIRENSLVSSDSNNKFKSVILHACSVENTGKGRTVRKIWQGTWSADKGGECARCHVNIPEGLLTLWKLHNWDALQIWYGGQHGKD